MKNSLSQNNFESVLIVSSIALSDVQKKEIETTINSQYSRKLTYSYKIDKEIIAGLYIRVGDKLFNQTLRKKIDDLLEVVQQ